MNKFLIFLISFSYVLPLFSDGVEDETKLMFWGTPIEDQARAKEKALAITAFYAVTQNPQKLDQLKSKDPKFLLTLTGRDSAIQIALNGKINDLPRKLQNFYVRAVDVANNHIDDNLFIYKDNVMSMSKNENAEIINNLTFEESNTSIQDPWCSAIFKIISSKLSSSDKILLENVSVLDQRVVEELATSLIFNFDVDNFENALQSSVVNVVLLHPELFGFTVNNLGDELTIVNQKEGHTLILNTRSPELNNFNPKKPLFKSRRS
jgi:hypothetical protein